MTTAEVERLRDEMRTRFATALRGLVRDAAQTLADRVAVRGASSFELAVQYEGECAGDVDEQETACDDAGCECCAPAADAAPGQAAEERGSVEREGGERARTRRGKRGGRKHRADGPPGLPPARE